jgi:penicillin-binding protein 2
MASWLPSLAEIRNSRLEIHKFRGRVVATQALVIVCFGLLLARLVYLQVVRHEDLQEQAEDNRTAVIPTVPTRGIIFDSNGEILANNYSAYTLEITPIKVDDVDATIEALSKIIDIQARD